MASRSDGSTSNMICDRSVRPQGLDRTPRQRARDLDVGGTALSPDAAALLALQRAVGNQKVAKLMAAHAAGHRPAASLQRIVATATPVPPTPKDSAQRDAAPGSVATATPAVAGTAPLTAAAGSIGSGAGKAPGEQQVVELYPIYDRLNRQRIMVNSDRYEQERAALGRLLRYLAKAIPDDAKTVLEAYPFEEVKDMYQEATEALTNSGRHYARGELAAAGSWAKEASQFTEIEPKAHKRFMEESVWSYVGKRVGLAVIGFFEGAAEAMVGLVDTGASLIGFHPDLEGKITASYTEIKDAYSAGTGIDHNLTHDTAIGRFGGKLAENLATGKAIGQLGKVGMVINVIQAEAGVKGTVETVVAMREHGKSWGDIVSDPVVLAQFAGSLAGVAGVGGAGIPRLTNALGTAGLVLTAGQMTALTATLVTYKDDPNLGEQENFAKRADLLANVLTSAAFLGEDVVAKGVKEPGPHAASEHLPGAKEPEAMAAPTAVPSSLEGPKPAIGPATTAEPAAGVGSGGPSTAVGTPEPAAAEGTAASGSAAHDRFDLGGPTGPEHTTSTERTTATEHTAPAEKSSAAKEAATVDAPASTSSPEAASSRSPGDGQVTGRPAGAVEQPERPKDDFDAFRLYMRRVGADRGREVGLIYNHRVQEWAVVQGEPGAVPLDDALANLGWSHSDTVLSRHSHPVGEQGETSLANQLPSGRGADLDVVRADAAKGQGPVTPQWSAIDVVTSGGKADKTYVFYDRATETWTLHYPSESAPGGRARVSFSSTADYHAWFKAQFGFEPGVPTTTTTHQLPTPRAAESLLSGEEIVRPPETSEELFRSNEEIDAARAVLLEPASTSDAREDALGALAQRAVAEYRTLRAAQRVRLGDGEYAAIRLTAESLSRSCGEGRDVTAESIASLALGSQVPVTIARYQVDDLGVNERHGFSVVRQGDGTPILVDPTYAQFPGDPVTAHHSRTMEASDPRGAQIADRLLRDGFIPLDQDTARLYLLSIGATPEVAARGSQQMLAGEKAMLHETIIGDRIERNVPGHEMPEDIREPHEGPGEHGIIETIEEALPYLQPGSPQHRLLELLGDRFRNQLSTPRPVTYQGDR